jgi:hypothetical protein
VPHPDVDAEQAYLDEAYRCLTAMRDRTARTAAIAEGAAQEVDSAIAQQHLAHRLSTLDVDVPGLSFGRLDGEDGGRWYVGRRHVEDDRGDPVVVDWRADVAVPFYRATAVDPLGLRRRRRFMMTGSSTTCSTRCSTTPTASTPPTTAGSPTPCWPSSSASGRGRCGTSSPRSRPSRTR